MWQSNGCNPARGLSFWRGAASCSAAIGGCGKGFAKNPGRALNRSCGRGGLRAWYVADPGDGHLEDLCGSARAQGTPGGWRRPGWVGSSRDPKARQHDARTTTDGAAGGHADAAAAGHDDAAGDHHPPLVENKSKGNSKAMCAARTARPCRA